MFKPCNSHAHYGTAMSEHKICCAACFSSKHQPSRKVRVPEGLQLRFRSIEMTARLQRFQEFQIRLTSPILNSKLTGKSLNCFRQSKEFGKKLRIIGGKSEKRSEDIMHDYATMIENLTCHIPSMNFVEKK